MHYQFPPDVEQRIRAQIETGEFETEDEVIREALDTLEKRQSGLKEMQEMIKEADEDVVAGRVGPFDAEETKRAVRQLLGKSGIAD